MSAVAQKIYMPMSLDDYYRICANETDIKYELFRGVLYAMTRGSPRHARLGGTLFALLHNQIKLGDKCRPYNSDYHVGHDFDKLPGHNKVYTPFRAHPDVSIVCGKPEYIEGDACSNPTVLFEVTSPGTEDYDFELKFDEYKRIETLQSYVIVSHDSPCVSVFERELGWSVKHHFEGVINIHGFDVDIHELYAWAEE